MKEMCNISQLISGAAFVRTQQCQ